MKRDNDFDKKQKIIPVEKTVRLRDQITDEELEDMLEETEEEDRDYQQDLATNLRWKRLLLSVGVLAVVLGVVLYIIWNGSVSYASVKEQWVHTLNSNSLDFQSVPYASGILQYNASGISYYNARGDVQWTKTYEMHRPQAFITDNYVAIADIGYSTIVIFNTDGYQGTATSPLPVSTISVSGTGVVAAVVEEKLGNHILFFDRTGTKLEIDIRTLMDQSGYPMSVSISPDGQMLMVSFVYLDQGMMNNKLVFYNFQEGSASSERMVGAFQQYGDTLFARVKFLDNRHAVAFGDGKLVFYSLKNRVSAQELAVVSIDDTIQKVFCGDDYVAVVTDNTEGTASKTGDAAVASTILVYNGEGVLQHTLKASYVPNYVGVMDQGVYYHNENTLTVVSKMIGGYEKRFQGSFGMTLRTVVNIRRDHTFMVLSDDVIAEMKLMK